MRMFSGEVKYTANADDPFPWTTANSMCTLATPRLMTSSITNVTLDLRDEDDLVMAEGEELWVGYVRRPVLLQYIGKISSCV